MRRVYRQGFDARAAFRRMTMLTPASTDATHPAADSSLAPTAVPRARGRIIAFAIRIARAIVRRAKPLLGPVAFRGRRYLFTEQAAQLAAMHRALDEGRLMTATWANQEQGKFAARVVAEVQSSRRMVLDRSALAHAVQADAMAALARDIADIRGALGADTGRRSHALLDATLVPGATVVHVGDAGGAVLEYSRRKVGADGGVAAVGHATSLDSVFAEAVVDVVCIDAPGHEMAVVQGARRSLAHHADVRIMVRFDGAAVRRAGMSVATWFAAFAEAGFDGALSLDDEGRMQRITADSLEQVEFCELLFSRPRP